MIKVLKALAVFVVGFAVLFLGWAILTQAITPVYTLLEPELPETADLLLNCTKPVFIMWAAACAGVIATMIAQIFIDGDVQ